MIYVLLEKVDSPLQRKIIEFVKTNIKYNNFIYQIIFNEQHIIESTLDLINNEKDIILWHPKVAYNNLEIIKNFQNSIVILEKPSIYLQKISANNPINENLAINYGFYIVYINPDYSEITNDDWKLVVKENMYLITIEKLLYIINSDNENIKTEKIIVPDVFDSIVDIVKNQINLS